MHFQAIARDLLFSRQDPNDRRRGDDVQLISQPDKIPTGVVIGGYPDDEGVRNNGGRVGAANGPDSIRQYLYRMSAGHTPLYDCGNLMPHENLPVRHEAARQMALSSLNAGHRWIGLGGGHDYAYADGAALLDFASQRPIIVNFDAHLDVRPPSPAINSGTSFFRLTELGRAYDFVQIGIQPQCNSEQHLSWSRDKGHLLLTLQDYWQSNLSLTEFVVQRMGDLLLRPRPCFLSVDIDAFAWPYAIGSSQSWPTGLEPKEFWPCFLMLQRRFDVRVLGIYETAPPLDFGDGTAKLAAQIVDAFLRGVAP